MFHTRGIAEVMFFLFNLQGTGHWYGINKADVEELKGREVEVVILSKGQWSFLHVPPSLVEELQALGLEVIVEPTSTAKETYNSLVKQGKRVASLIHTTC